MRALLLAITLLAAFPAQAQMPGEHIVKSCEAAIAEDFSKNASTCLTYFAGLHNASALWTGFAVRNELPKLFCAAPEIPPTDHIRVWLKHVEENPDDLARNALFSYLIAMRKAFPCSE